MSKLLIVAGEASADHHGAAVVKALKDRGLNPNVWGVGGNSLVSQGADLVATSKELGVVGIFEVIAKWSVITRAFREIVKRAKSNPPDVALLIDYPGFNIRLAKVLKKMGIPVVYYISPQVWAWKPGRIKTLKSCISEMLVVFKFEEEIYKNANVPVRFVGHPLLEQVSENDLPIDGLSSDKPIVTLMPGSRLQEIRRLMPPIIDAVRRIHQAKPEVQFALPLAPTIDRSSIECYLTNLPFKVTIVENNRTTLIKRSAAAIVCSGTATLDVGLACVPMVIIYKLAPVSYFIGKVLIRPQLFGMANVLLEREVVPELLQQDVTGEKISLIILEYLSNNQRASQVISQLSKIKEILGEPGASRKVADRITTYLRGGHA